MKRNVSSETDMHPKKVTVLKMTGVDLVTLYNFTATVQVTEFFSLFQNGYRFYDFK